MTNSWFLVVFLTSSSTMEVFFYDWIPILLHMQSEVRNVGNGEESSQP